MNTIAYIGLAAVIGLLVNVGIMAVAFAEPTAQINTPKTWIFVTHQTQCTDDNIATLHTKIVNEKFSYVNQTKNPFEIVCFPSADLATVDKVIPLLRAEYPNDMFIFLYDLIPNFVIEGKMANQTSSDSSIAMYKVKTNWSNLDHFYWKATLATMTAGQATESDFDQVQGLSLIESGVAFSDDSPEPINHEWTHLSTCSVHGEGTDDRNPTTWARIGNYPWCPREMP